MEQVGVEFTIVSDKAEKNTKSLSDRLFNLDNAASKTKNTISFLKEEQGKYNKILENSVIGSKEYTNAKKNLEKIESKLGTTKDNQKEKNNLLKQGAMNAFEFAKGMLIANGVMKIFSSLMSSFPQIGEMFSEIGQIISMNLLKPLANEIIPLIKKLGVWVANNKALFVMLGSVIANVFRGVVLIIKTVFSVIQTLGEAVFGKVTMSVKDMGRSISDFFNFLVLKITFALTFLAIFLEPIFKALGNTIRAVYDNAIVPFLKGLSDGFGNASLDIEYLQKAFVEFFDLLTESFITMKPFFTLLGQVFGVTLRTGFEGLKLVAIGLFEVIKFLIKIPQYIKSGYDSLMKFVSKWDTFKTAISSFWSKWGNVISTVVTVFNPLVGISMLIYNNFDKIVSLVDLIISKFDFIQEGFQKLKSFTGGLFNKETPKVEPNVNLQGAKTDNTLSPRGTTIKNESNTENKNTFNIKSDNPEQVAKEVEKILEKQKDNPKKQFNKFALSQGIQ